MIKNDKIFIWFCKIFQTFHAMEHNPAPKVTHFVARVFNEDPSLLKQQISKSVKDL